MVYARYFYASLLIALASPAVLAADVFVVTNKSSTLNAGEIKDIFTGERQIENGVKIVPVDNASLQKDFLEKVIKVDASKYASIWAKKGFREGLNPPGVKSTDAEVIAVLKSTPGGIGYISKPNDDVKVLQKF